MNANCFCSRWIHRPRQSSGFQVAFISWDRRSMWVISNINICPDDGWKICPSLRDSNHNDYKKQDEFWINLVASSRLMLDAKLACQLYSVLGAHFMNHVLEPRQSSCKHVDVVDVVVFGSPSNWVESSRVDSIRCDLIRFGPGTAIRLRSIPSNCANLGSNLRVTISWEMSRELSWTAIRVASQSC